MSLHSDFLILFFTEALFYGGVAIYVLLIDHVNRSQDPVAPNTYGQIKTNFGLRILSVATLVLSLIIPLVTMGMVWPWTGPAASATLAPYLVGLVVQFAFEQYARYRRSTACAVIPIVFQVSASALFDSTVLFMINIYKMESSVFGWIHSLVRFLVPVVNKITTIIITFFFWVMSYSTIFIRFFIIYSQSDVYPLVTGGFFSESGP